MRRTVLSGILALTLLLGACAEQPTEAPSQPLPPTPSELIGGPEGCTLNDLLDLTKAILPPSSELNTLISWLKALPVNPPPRFMELLRRSVFRIIDYVSRAYEAGKLVDSPDTPGNVLAFIQGMYCFAEMTPPTFSMPDGPIDPDEFAFTVITQTSGPVTLLPNSEQGGLQFQASTLPAGVPAVTVTLFRLPDGPPGPLLTSLDQYPLFYEFSVSPQVEFTKFVIGGVCLGDNFAASNSLRLAHNVGDNWGDVEILPFADPTFLNCENLPLTGPIGSFGRIRSLFASFLLPARLHATNTALETTGVGGALKRLSPFGSVDPNSNPADLDFNGEFDELSAPAGTAVTPAPSVVVRSMNGTPIANVPVDFAVGEGGGTVNGGSSATVTTDNDGIATVESWILGDGPGTYTLEATPRHVEQDPATEEGLPDPPYRPAAEFDPASLTFSATTEDERFESTTLITSHDPNPSIVGQGITVSILVTARSETKTIRPTGTVQVTDGNDASCTATLGLVAVPKDPGNIGECTLTPVNVGALTLTAVYSGNSELNGSSDTEQHMVIAERASSIGAGGAHSCAVRTDGTVRCWGNNQYGQSTAPEGLTGVVGLDLDDNSTCAVTNEGSVECWGDNLYGESTVPSGLSDVVEVGVGVIHTCALKNDGTVICWGSNDEGIGQTEVPEGLSGVTALSVSGYHNCALKSDGTVTCWGDRNGLAGMPEDLTDVRAVSAGGQHTCALKNVGTVICWGFNGYGQGNVPAGLTGVKTISAGAQHTCVIQSDDTARCWGRDEDGQSTVPEGLSDVVEVSGGGFHTCALKDDGSVTCWGGNQFGQATVPQGLNGE